MKDLFVEIVDVFKSIVCLKATDEVIMNSEASKVPKRDLKKFKNLG